MTTAIGSKYISNLMGLDPLLLRNKQKDELPFWLPKDETILFNSARQALFHGYKLLSLPKDSFVFVPAFICNTVTAPLSLAGANLVYYRINKFLQPDFDHIKALMGHYGKNNCKALLWYHYLGFSYGMSEAKHFCDENSLVFIEDAAHTLPHNYEYSELCPGKFGDIAIFSVRKTLPVLHAGALLVKDKNILLKFDKKFKESNVSANQKNEDKKNQLRGIYDAMKYEEKDAFEKMKNIYIEYVKNLNSCDEYVRDKTRNGIKNADITFEYLDNPLIVDKDSLNVIQNTNIHQVADQRRLNYSHLLAHIGEWALYKELQNEDMPLGFSICVPNRDEIRMKLAIRGVESSTHWPDWLLPITLGKEHQFEHIFANQLLTLPCHQDLSLDDMNYVGSTLNELLT